MKSLRELTEKQYWENFTDECVFDLIHDFTFWLIKRLVKDNIQNVYFCSRDSFLVYKLYLKIKEKSKDNLPNCEYLETSRRAICYSGLFETSDEDVMNELLKHNAKLGQSISIKNILDNFDIENNDVDSSSLELNRYIPQIKDKCRIERADLCEYLGTFQWDSSTAIVDVGWRGSIFNELKKITNQNIKGYYFCLEKKLMNPYRKDLYDYIGNRFLQKKIILNNRMILEFIFSSPDGSLKYIYKSENKLYFKKIDDDNNTKKAKQVISDKFQERIQDIDNPYFKRKRYVLKPLIRYLQLKKKEDLYMFSMLRNSVGVGEEDNLQKYVVIISSSDSSKKIKKKISTSMWKKAYLFENNGDLKKSIYVELVYFTEGIFSLFEKIIKVIKRPTLIIKYTYNVIMGS